MSRQRALGYSIRKLFEIELKQRLSLVKKRKKPERERLRKRIRNRLTERRDLAYRVFRALKAFARGRKHRNCVHTRQSLLRLVAWEMAGFIITRIA